eukprot:TRINITY_DN112756_c0_g1_i1.p1 TRINITY_DN112756_c0_g1~~TRINITY_DN112756_c0_g1_i1.p1  ORF type:complete len:733 (+),score=154.71 TRINITY_DN112756_c0_g1_i1:138-2336(+)
MANAAAQGRQIHKVYSEWCVKAAEIVLASRTEESVLNRAAHSTSSFNLKVPEIYQVRSEPVGKPDFFQIRQQRSFQVDIYELPESVPSPPSSSSSSPVAGASDVGTAEAPAANGKPADQERQLLERWTFTFYPAAQSDIAVSTKDPCNQTIIQKMSVTLRSLLCYTRLLPAYSYCRHKPSQIGRRLQIPADLSASSLPSDFVNFDFTSLQSSAGTLRLYVAYAKDLKSTVPCPFQASSQVTSSLDRIEVDDSFFSSSEPQSTVSAPSLGRLDKIAEEPQRQAANKATKNGAPAQTAAPAGGYSAGESLLPRPRCSSMDSVGSTQSTSSRGAPVPDHTIVLGAMPPLAAAAGCRSPPPGLITLGPRPDVVSAPPSLPNSRTPSPQSTPPLGPCPEPGAANSGAGGVSARKHKSMPAQLSSSMESGGAALTAPPSPVVPGRELDNLSDLWPRPFKETRGLGRNQLRSSETDAPRGASSRSPSPDMFQRGGFGCSSGRASALFSSEAEMTAEIRMHGMSSDEEQQQEEDEDTASEAGAPAHDEELRKNIIASTLGEGTGGDGAFADIGATLDLGLGGLEGCLDSEPPPMKAKQSPLIAGLNPFSTPPWVDENTPWLTAPPTLDLPPSMEAAAASVFEDGADAGPPCSGKESIVMKSSLAASGAATMQAMQDDAVVSEGPVDRLLVDMGGLICKLQQKRELLVTQLEENPQELLERLQYFREFAESRRAEMEATLS